MGNVLITGQTGGGNIEALASTMTHTFTYKTNETIQTIELDLPAGFCIVKGTFKVTPTASINGWPFLYVGTTMNGRGVGAHVSTGEYNTETPFITPILLSQVLPLGMTANSNYTVSYEGQEFLSIGSQFAPGAGSTAIITIEIYKVTL
ncbi:MAG: hypothetical protein FWG88_04975 [Oscillospiraceae bacterium]|nr:hypothetical protein [Oscillospiraceae bacterium]